MLIVALSLDPVKDNILLLFFGSVALTSALEFVTGFVLEQFFNDKWWDYSKEPLNLYGYVCLRFSLIWGLACLLVVYVVYPLTTRFIDLIPQTPGLLALGIFALLTLADTTVSLVETLKLKRKLVILDNTEKGIRRVSERIGGALANGTLDAKERLEERKEAVALGSAKARSDLSAIQSRILRAYPRLRHGRYQNSIARLKFRIKSELGNSFHRPVLIDDPRNIISDIPVVLYQRTFETVIDVLEARDEYTAGHSRRVAVLTKRFCKQLKVHPLEADVLELAASLHDLGKVGIPDATLNKCEKLDEVEWSEMRRHPDIGADIILKSGVKMDRVAEIVRHHHEHWDGSGYPAGLKGEQIPKGSQIISICDAVDSMMIERVYRQALPPDVCKAEIAKDSGSLFCPELVDLFLENWDVIVSGVYSEPRKTEAEAAHSQNP